MAFPLVAGCTGSGAPFDTTVAAISFANEPNANGGAGEFYNELVRFNTEGGAAQPDKFELTQGVLPPGLRLCNDGMEEIGDTFTDEVDGVTRTFPLSSINIHEDVPGVTVFVNGVEQASGTFAFNGRTVTFNVAPPAGSTVEIRYTIWVCDGGQPTGNARISGFPREQGSFQFGIKAISTGALGGPLAQNGQAQPDVAAVAIFIITIGEGTINILTPTAVEGTEDPETPAFPAVINFVNPADPQAFFAFAFLIAGGTGDNCLNIYAPRELELSVFDLAVTLGPDGVAGTGDEALVTDDLDETSLPDGAAGSGDKYRNNFADGGWFIQAGGFQVQVGGFQSPRGTPNLGTGITNLFAEWFQQAPLPARNSRRRASDPDGFAAGDPSLGTVAVIEFSDYFDGRDAAGNPIGPDNYVIPGPDTVPQGGKERAKYPFEASEYANAFFSGLGFDPAVDATPLKYRMIVEAVDKRNTPDKGDDIISRKAFIVQVRIPDIQVDTVVLPQGRAGVLYTEFANGSGGVPPLKFDLEHIDGNAASIDPTDGHTLDKQLFGLNMEESTGLILGIPRASGQVKFTIRVFADVMNPKQGPVSDAVPPVPTGTAGEVDGNLTLGGVTKKGRHRTIVVDFQVPFPADIANAGLPTGIDGQPYPQTTIQLSGGVGKYTPYPPDQDLTGPALYNFGQAENNAEYSVRYQVDTSHPKAVDPLQNINGTDADPFGPNPGDDTVDGVPIGMSFNGGPTFIDTLINGDLFGACTDRGFHATVFSGIDFYAGNAQVANGVNFRTSFSKLLTISIAPDSIVYLGGSPDGEAGGIELTTDGEQRSEVRMVPMITASALKVAETGSAPVESDLIPKEVDLLPVLISNGGNDSHTNREQPSIGGFWPPEAGNETEWTTSTTTRQQAHLQQQHTYIVAGNGNHNRCYLYAETEIKKFANVTNNHYSHRYQMYDPAGERGIMMVDPLSGDFWIVAKLNNSSSGANADGSQFGAEFVSHRDMRVNNTNNYGVQGTNTTRYYGHSRDHTRPDREVQGSGLSSYIESFNRGGGSGNGWMRMSMGRAGTTVAVSADGRWAATAMPGGTNEQKILIWSLNNEPIPQAMLDAGADGVEGCLADGTLLDEDGEYQAAIIRLGGQTFDGPGGDQFVLPSDHKDILTDSLMFVDGGLVFTNFGQLDKVFGVDMVACRLTYMDLDDHDVEANATEGSGTRPFSVNPTTGQFIPDRDIVIGFIGQQSHAVQFAFSGDTPDDDTLGSNVIAFVAGENRETWEASTTGLDPDLAKPGYTQRSNRRKAVMAIEIAVDGGGGLDLTTSTLIDVTGSDIDVYGDYQGPGAEGEQNNRVQVSPDGTLVAAVRDFNYLGDGGNETASSFSVYVPTFHNGSTSTSFTASDDLVVAAIDGSDLSSAAGHQHVLYIGTQTNSLSGSAAAGMPTYATSRNLINASYRRIFDLVWDDDGESVMFKYAGWNQTGTHWNPKYYGSTIGYAINPNSNNTRSFKTGLQLLLRVDIKNSDGTVKNWSTANSGTLIFNMLRGLAGTAGIGPTGAPFNETSSSEQLFWVMFKSPDSRFLYVISDQLSSTNLMIGFNITDNTINGRLSFAPFSPHSAAIGFEWCDNTTQNYDPRFVSQTSGVFSTASGVSRDATGILCVVASDASAGAGSSTDLEIYVMDVNNGTNMVVLTSTITGGTANSINHLYLSANGNVLIFQRSTATGNSGNGRSTLNSDNDLCAVMNVHAVLFNNAAPDGFIVSTRASHGASIALVGEGTAAGPQAIVFSRAARTANGGGNNTWEERLLYIASLAETPIAAPIDSAASMKSILAAGRKIDDNPETIG